MCHSRAFYAYVSKQRCVIFSFLKNWTIDLGAIYISVHKEFLMIYLLFVHLFLLCFVLFCFVAVFYFIEWICLIDFILSVPFERTSRSFFTICSILKEGMSHPALSSDNEVHRCIGSRVAIWKPFCLFPFPTTNLDQNHMDWRIYFS